MKEAMQSSIKKEAIQPSPKKKNRSFDSYELTELIQEIINKNMHTYVRVFIHDLVNTHAHERDSHT